MIRVLIADESQRITDNLTRRLGNENDIVVCGTSKDGEQAVQEALRLQPDVAIIDTGLPGLDGVQTTEMLAQHLPNTGVIMTSMEGENEAYRRAMLAGAREYLQKPFTGDELVAAVRRVHMFQQRKAVAASTAHSVTETADIALDEPQHSGQVFTIMSGKGGVGKSVLATNLAIALAQQTHEKVALCDLSLQFGDVAALLNLPIDKSIVDLAANDAVADRDVISEVLADGPEGIKVLVAPVSPELADYVTTQHLRALMEELRRTFDYVIIDGPSYLNEITLEALETADLIVLVTDLSVTSVKNTRLLLSVMDVLKIDDRRVQLVDNHHRGDVGGLDRASAEAHLKRQFVISVPHDPQVFEASISHGIPSLVANPTSPSSQAIKELAAQLAPVETTGSTKPTTPPDSQLKKKPRRLLGFARTAN